VYVAVTDRGVDQSAGSGSAYGPAADGTGSLAELVSRARLQPRAGEAPELETTMLTTLVAGAERPVARVAALSQTAQTAMRLGRASECFAVLAEQRSAAGDDPAALVWALTSSAACHSIFGQLECARANLAQARQACNYAAPLLAEPFWRFADIVCGWLGGDWVTAEADATALDQDRAGPFPATVAGTVTALRVELLRGLGQRGECQRLAERLAGLHPAEMCAWALAGLDADQGRPEDALRRLADAADIGDRDVYRTPLPLILHRMAEIGFAYGDQDVTSYAASALATLDQAAPMHAILTGLAQSYATRDAEPARRAQRQAEACTAGALAAEALVVRGQVGDEPETTLPAGHAAWLRIGAAGRAGAVAALMRAAGIPAPLVQRRVARTSLPARPDALTARERALARLVHEGRSNQQIARTLHISVKTVEAYLTRLYRKTSCSSRVELAVAVTERRIQVGE